MDVGAFLIMIFYFLKVREIWGDLIFLDYDFHFFK